MSKYINLAAGLWIFSALYLTHISRWLFSPGPEYNGGEYYIFFILFYSLLIIIVKRIKKNVIMDIPYIAYWIGVAILLWGFPLFENDHYRYLWEGKVFLNGFSPYVYPPNSKLLEFISFTKKESIGFSHLTTVYPPLAIVWFGLGGVFDFVIGLRIMMVLNGVLVFLLLRDLSNRIKSPYLFLLYPYFQKEFIQAIHIDLLAFITFYFALVSGKENQNKIFKAFVFIFISYWVKILGILGIFMIPFQVAKIERKKIFFIVMMALVPMSLFIGLSFLTNGTFFLGGAKAFSDDWVWNPGLYGLLHYFFNISNPDARHQSLLIYALYLAIVGAFFLYKIIKNNWSLTKNDSVELSYLIFAGLMFCSPVYNGWYAIWFFVPALILSNISGIFYGVFSCLCYISYSSIDGTEYSMFLTHFLFIPSVIEIFHSTSRESST